MYDLHDSVALYAIAKNLGFRLDDYEKIEKEKADLKCAISGHASFEVLSPDVKKQIMKGRKSTLQNQIQIVESRGINSTEFQGIYKLLSTHTHSTATSIKQAVHYKLNSPEMDVAFLGLTVSYTSCFIAEMVNCIGAMWDVEFAKEESSDFIEYYASQLYESV